MRYFKLLLYIHVLQSKKETQKRNVILHDLCLLFMSLMLDVCIFFVEHISCQPSPSAVMNAGRSKRSGSDGMRKDALVLVQYNT